MKAVLLKEIRLLILGPKFFSLLALFTVLSGMVFLSLVNQFNPLLQQAAMVPNQSVSLNDLVIAPFWSALRVLLLFIVPITAMGIVSKEREQFTLPLLLVSTKTSFEIVLGKFLALAFAALLITLCQFIFPLALWSVASLELLPALVGGFSLLMLTVCYSAIGLVISTFSASQIVAGTLTFIALFIVHSADAFSSDFGGPISHIVQSISPNEYLEHMQRGVIRSSDLVYFLSVILLSLFLAAERLELERGA